MRALLVAVLASAVATAVPTGRWSATITGAPAARFNGVWTVAFAANGAYTVTEDGQVLIRGRATFSKTTVTFRDASGPAACRGKQAIGSYAWRATSRVLTLKPKREPCSGRRFVLGRRFAKTG